jgi:hypothetical protein
MVRTSDGREYNVPTPDHAAVNPKGTFVVVFSDNDSHTDVAGLHIAAGSSRPAFKSRRLFEIVL